MSKPPARRQAEIGAAKVMIERTADRFGLKPDRLAADTAYGSAEMLNWLVKEREIAPYVPVIDKSARRDGIFARIFVRMPFVQRLGFDLLPERDYSPRGRCAPGFDGPWSPPTAR